MAAMRSLDGDNWAKVTARIGFPILVEYARFRRKITYRDWDGEIVHRGLGHHVPARVYGWPAGSIGDACEEYSIQTGVDVPPINLMVVNSRTGVPGHGADSYIRRFCWKFLRREEDPSDLTLNEKRAIIDRALEEIFDFSSWGDVLKAFELEETEATRSARRAPRRRPSAAPVALGHGSGVRSPPGTERTDCP